MLKLILHFPLSEIYISPPVGAGRGLQGWNDKFDQVDFTEWMFLLPSNFIDEVKW